MNTLSLARIGLASYLLLNMPKLDIERELVLIMTASVDPKGMPAPATVANPLGREQDYLDTLQYYLANHPRVRRIVFAENSNWPLDKFIALANSYRTAKEVEFLSFSLNDFPREYGKSYGELVLMSHAFEKSNFISQAKYVAKMTGRNRLLNLTAMLETFPRDCDFYADLKDHPLYEWMNIKASGRHAESRFFVITPQFFEEHFSHKEDLVRDNMGYMIENLIYHVAKSNLKNGRAVGRFRSEPVFRGIAGHNNKDYGSFTEKLKRGTRRVLRKIVPWLWI